MTPHRWHLCPPFEIVGINGATMEQRFEPYPEAYMTTSVDGFPNFGMMMGPNAGIGTGSLTKIIESVGDYISKCIRKIQKEDIKSMQVKTARVRNWSAYIDAYFPRTVYLDNCKSWWRSHGGRGTRIIGIWPGSTLHAVETLRSPRWEDFDYEYEESEEHPITGNRLRWLDNGWSELQLEKDRDLSYYIEDPYVDVPATPLPERTSRWNHVSYSH